MSSVVLSESQFLKRWSALLRATLETWAHQLLYLRRVYPHDTFAKSTFLGLRVSVNRHPDVISYISRAVEMAVPALVDQAADKVSLEISDTAKDGTSSKVSFVLRFSEPTQTKGVPLDQLNLLERSMRDLIVSTYSLESERSLSNAATFAIRLHLLAGKQSPRLSRGFQVGDWYVPQQAEQDNVLPATVSVLQIDDACIGNIQFETQRN